MGKYYFLNRKRGYPFWKYYTDEIKANRGTFPIECDSFG